MATSACKKTGHSSGKRKVTLKDYMRRSYKKGDFVFKEGERGAEAYLISSGRVLLYKTENGEMHEIDEIGSPRIFGEMGVIADANRMATAQVTEDCELVCCHRRELVRRMDALDEDRRDAMRFLIIYCQEFLPYELMENRPDTEETQHMDSMARGLVKATLKPGELDDLDGFMRGLYQVLISYAERRLPPHLAW